MKNTPKYSYTSPLSYTGVIIAVLFFSLSLSPSLLPRPFILQGLLSGVMLCVGYMLGMAIVHIWSYFQLPFLKDKSIKAVRILTILFSVSLYLYTIYYSNNWQNELRHLMGLSPNESGSHLYIGLISLFVVLVFLSLVRSFLILYSVVKKKLNVIIPPNIAMALSAVFLSAVVFFFANNFLISKILIALDSTYLLIDENLESDISPPTHNLSTGSNESLIAWRTVGKTGQDFITQGPKKPALDKYFDENTLEPIRVYAGLRTKETAEERADVALKELIRVNAFSRAKLVIATPTGTGWIDPLSIDTFEYLHKGDTATVTMQYSYLPSWLTLLVDPTSARVSSAAMYNKIHSYWSKLPKETRPDLYLFGLSLGALGAETSINLTTIVNNPIQGALFVGAPFDSTISPILTKNRNEGSLQRLPVIQDSSMVRYMAHNSNSMNNDISWGPIRLLYIQYASDPIVFFSRDMYRKEPDWMKEERAFDVSSSFKWIPIVSFFQVLFDIPMAEKAPRGSAHNYSASSYIDGWLEVSEPMGWNIDKINSLKKHFEIQH